MRLTSIMRQVREGEARAEPKPSLPGAPGSAGASPSRSRTLLFVACLLFLQTPVCFAAEKITYEDHLLPILRNECTSCHNPDKKKGGLDLSSYQAILTGSDSGAVVAAGDPDNSKLFKVVAHTDDPNMPKGKGKLPDKDVNVFKQWIAGGMLENAGGKAVVAKGKPKLNLSVVADAGKPQGPVAMPKDLPVEPVVHTTRPGALMCLAASPWAPLAAIGGQHQVLLYNTDTLELLGVLPFTEGDPYVLRFSRNGSMLLVGGGVSAKSGRAALFDVASGNRVTQIGDEFDAVIAADISADQSTVALGGPGKTLKIYSTADGQLLHAIKKHTDWVTAIAYSPDGVLLASGDRAGGLWVWEARSGNEFYGLTGHKAAITAVSFRGDSNILASASEDGTVKLWDMQSGNLVKSINAHGPGVLDVSFTHDGRLVTCGRDRLVRIWKPDGSALLATQPFADIALHAAFDGDGKRVVAGDWTGSIRVFDAKTAKPVGELTANPAGVGERLADANKQLTQAQANYATLAAALDQATQQLNHARAQVSQLKTAQVNLTVWHARDELSREQAELEKTRGAAEQAKLAADKAAADLAARQKLVSDAPELIKARERAIAEANQSVAQASSARDAAQAQRTRRIALAQQAGQIAQALADAAANASTDSETVAAAAKAKVLFDSLNQSVESVDRLLLAKSVDVEKRRAAVARAEAALAKQKSEIDQAPTRIASLRYAAQAAQEEHQKTRQAAEQVAQRVDAAKGRLQKLTREYHQLSQSASNPPAPQVAGQN